MPPFDSQDLIMPQPLQHSLQSDLSREQAARQDFVSGLRAFILNDMADRLRASYDREIAPACSARDGQPQLDGRGVHQALKSNHVFRFYSSMRYNAQEMVWRSALRPLAAHAAELSARIDAATARASEVGGSLTLDPGLEVPRNVAALDVHLAPGSYHREDEAAPWMGGALYDHGLNIFSFGMMGRNLDDIGQSMAQYIRHKFADFQPENILDIGCTIGHNTCAWKRVFPDAAVTGIDVAAPGLRYAHARAVDQGVAVDFRQMNATALEIPDASVDVVFSSMFLHELSARDIRKVMAEAHRVLRPGGLMLHMELPPNDSLSAFDAFYLDWDAYYNNEPFYKAFRDQDFTALRVEAGFSKDKLLQFITPQYSYMEPESYADAIEHDAVFSENTGRLAQGLQWYAFGAWK